jgi:hypothetical protein
MHIYRDTCTVQLMRSLTEISTVQHATVSSLTTAVSHNQSHVIIVLEWIRLIVITDIWLAAFIWQP